MPSLILIAGPNGAGKTTFANEFLSGERADTAFVNADEIAVELARGGEVSAIERRAARLMLTRVHDLIDAGRNMVVETTLATRVYAVKIPAWRRRGYDVTLLYLRLPSAEFAIQRVRRRAEAGGHSIPDDVVRRRFDLGLRYLETLYKSVVDRWYVWDSIEGGFLLREQCEKSPN